MKFVPFLHLGCLSLVALGTVLVQGAQLRFAASLGLTHPDDGRSNRAIAEYLRLSTSDINSQLANPAGHSVNLTILDSGGTQARAVANAFAAARVQGQGGVNAIGLIGEATSGLTVPMALIAQELNLYTCSGSATATSLSDSQVFTRTFRTIAADDGQGVALAQFIQFMGWRTCAVLASSSTYGRSIAKVFQDTALKLNLLVAALEFVDFGDGAESPNRGKSITRALEVAAASGVRVFVFLGVVGEFVDLATEAQSTGLIGTDSVWIGSEGLGELSVTSATDPKLRALTRGMFYAFPKEVVDATQAQSLVTRASQGNLPGVTSMEPYAAFFVDCYMALTTMFIEMLKSGTPEADVLGRNVRLPAARALKTFNGITGRVAFGADGSRLSTFSMFNIFDGKTVEAASVDASGQVKELTKPRFFSGTSTPPLDRPESVIAFVRFATAGGIVFLLVVGALVLATVAGAGMLVMYRTSIHVREYGLAVLLTVSLGLIVLLASTIAWLDEQSVATCNASLWGSSIGLHLILLPLLYRTFRTWRLSENILLWKRPTEGNLLSIVAIVNLFVVQVAYLALWTWLSPLQPKPFSSITSFSYQCRSRDPSLHLAFTWVQVAWHVLLLSALVYFTSATRSLRTPARAPHYTHFVAINFALCSAVAASISLIQVPSFALGSFWINALVVWYTVLFTSGMLHVRVLQQARNPTSGSLLPRSTMTDSDTLYSLLAQQYGHLRSGPGVRIHEEGLGSMDSSNGQGPSSVQGKPNGPARNVGMGGPGQGFVASPDRGLAPIPGKQRSVVGRFAVKFPGVLATWNQHQVMFALDEGYFGVTKMFGDDASFGQVWRIAHVGARKAQGMSLVIEVLVEGKVAMWIQANNDTQYKQLTELLPFHAAPAP